MKFETSENLPKYFKSIRKGAYLNAEQEREVIVRIQSGDDTAAHELVQANLKFVVKIANRHKGQGVPIDDLIQEGNVGLLEAARACKLQESGRFITYASLWIRKRINEAVAKTGRIVRLPHNQEYEIYKSKQRGDEVEAPKSVNIDRPVGDDSGTTLGDLILRSHSAVDASIENEDLKFKVARALNCLKDRDKSIIKDYFGIDCEYEVPTDMIAERYNMTNVRVCQIVKASIEKMRVHFI
jgi:RNA polymerase primary sigma factor